ncbi:hypothetical protein C7T35_15470 [Variovorax sp. WS11]|uniref:hypothetical protein n=1 Tax=Variovorax sp. WS11 TaxID=1105204 RepID=UPI000D0DC4AE|nr:hypothetical protein [Variovorax sp. WS11]NDZ12038.1 DUF2460 domain-containing protein [Variovorax sp. WS11]PSL83777.1 hypothetical protein C7T35_15470 [Variovorax sp. WS11]
MTGIVVLDDVIIPTSVLLAGLDGELGRENDRTRNQGGYATVNVIRDVTLRSWQIGVEPMSVLSVQDVLGIWEVSDAGAYGVLLADPIDSVVLSTQGALQGYMAGVEFGTVGFGNGCPTYGLRKLYTARGSSRKKARALTRPNGTPALLRGGSPVTIGVAAGNAGLSAAPVYVTFVADASQNVSAVTVGATTQVTLAAALSGLVVGGRLWLQDLTGTHASLLNGMSHEITAITGGSLNVYTLATNTAGKTITAAGTGKKYPQPDEALTWSGNFYVPVQFRDDRLGWSLAAAGQRDARKVSVPSAYLDEIREA